MRYVIHSLFYKLKKSKMFWILLAVGCVVLPLVQVGEIYLFNSGSEGEVTASIGYFFSWMAVPTSNISLLSGICISVFLAGEFREGTVRNALLSNKSRFAVFFGYTVVGGVIAFAFSLGTFTTSLLFYGLFFGVAPIGEAGADIAYLLIQTCFASLVTLSMVVFFLFATRKQAPTIILPIVLQTVLDLVAQVGSMIAVAQEINISVLKWVPVLHYTLVEQQAVPIFDFLFGEGTKVASMDGTMLLSVGIYSAAFSVLMCFLASLMFKKADLK